MSMGHAGVYKRLGTTKGDHAASTAIASTMAIVSAGSFADQLDLIAALAKPDELADAGAEGVLVSTGFEAPSESPRLLLVELDGGWANIMRVARTEYAAVER